MGVWVRASCLLVGVVLAVAAGADLSTPPVASAPATAAASQPDRPARITLDLGDGVKMELALIPAGKFLMGSTTEMDEKPPREVTISRAFHLGVTEVTQAQYEAVTGGNPSHVKSPTNPVDGVSWDDAVAFCKKLSERSGKVIRLPTEAEWEYGCRAGTKGSLFFGEDEKLLDAYCWHSDNSGGTAHPVAGKKPNPWGLHDVYGNVGEWVHDFHGPYARLAATDPRRDDGNHRVMRGGSCANPPSFCRSANRAGAGPEARRKHLGFRVVVEAR